MVNYCEASNIKLCVFFGHRDCPSSIEPILREKIKSLICDNQITDFWVGNNGRFDYLVREILKEYETTYNIKYQVVLSRLPSAKAVVPNYDATHYTIPEGIENVPPKFSIDFRNRYMLKHATFIIAYITHDFGTGAAKYVALAKNKHSPIINIADLQ